MAESMELKVEFTPELNVRAFNVLLNNLKTALGPLGKDIKLIDANKVKSELAALGKTAKTELDNIKKGGKGVDDTLASIGVQAERTAGKASLLTRAFAFNQVVQSVQQVTGAFQQFLVPYQEFDKQLKNIGTLGVKNFEDFRYKAIDLAASVPDTVAGVTEAIYNGISAGAIRVVDGVADIDAGMKFVAQSSKLAVAGLTSTNDAIKGLSAVTNAYGAAIESPAVAADILFATVKNGVTTIPELNQSLSNVVPIAAAAKVGFDEVGASVATLTKQGVPTAQATTQIRAGITELLKPGAELKKVMDAAGVSVETLQKEGLQVTMRKIGEAMKASGTDAANTFSSIEAVQFALATTGDNAQKFKADLEAIRAGAGSVEEAFAIANEGIGVKVQGILNQIEAVAFKAFGAVGDGVTTLLSASAQIAPMVATFAGLATIIPPSAIASAQKLGVTMLTYLVPGMVTYDVQTKAAIINSNALTLSNIREGVAKTALTAATAIQTGATSALTAAQTALNAAFLASPIGWVVLGIAAIVGGMILLYNNVESVRNVFNAAWGVIVTGATGVWNVLKSIGSVLVDVGGFVLSVIIAPFKIWYSVISNIVGSAFSLIGTLTGIFDTTSSMNGLTETLAATFEKVVYYIDAAGIGIKGLTAGFNAGLESITTGIDKLFSLDFGGAFDAFFGAGEEAAKAFKDSIDRETQQYRFDALNEKLQNELSKGLNLQLQLDDAEGFENLVTEYENAQNRINELSQKKSSGLLSGDESDELQKLESDSQRIAASIAKINPELKSNFRTVVDEAGNIRQIYDINISKAKELADSNNAALDLTEATNKFSDSLSQQATTLDEQQSKLAEYGADIEKNTDPTKVEELTKRFQDQKKQVDDNKQALIENFQKGAEAGLLTEKALEKIATELGITSEEAKRLALGSELKKITEEGAVTEDQIKKLSEKYGISEKIISDMLKKQKEIREETEKTDAAAKSWGDSLKAAREKQSGAYDTMLQAQRNFNAGLITESEYNKIMADARKKLADGQNEIVTLQTAANDLKKQGITFEETDVKLQDEKAKKQQVNAESAYSRQKALFDQQNSHYEAGIKQANATAAYERAKKGIILNEAAIRQENIKEAQREAVIAEQRVTQAQKLFDLASRQRNIEAARGKISSKTQNEYDAALNSLTNLNIELTKSKTASINVQAKYDADIESSKAAADKIRRELQKSNLQFDVELGISDKSELIQFEINEITDEISEQNKIKLGLDPDLEADKIAEIDKKVSALNQDLYKKQSALDEQLQTERINRIEDLSKREREIKLAALGKTYQDEINAASGNNSLILKATNKLLLDKYQAEQNYLQSTQTLYQSAAVNIATSFQNAFASGFDINIDSSANNQSKENIQAIDEEIAATERAYKRGELSRKEYNDKLKSLEADRASEMQGFVSKTEQILKGLADTVSKTFSSISDNIKLNIQASTAAFQDNLIIQQQATFDVREKQAEATAALKSGDTAAWAAATEEIKALETAKLESIIANTEIASEVYSNAAILMTSNFSAMVSSGKNAMQSMILAALSGLKALIPIFVAQIFGITAASPANIATLGIWGAVKFAALTAAFYGLVGVAESAVASAQFYRGGLNRSGFGGLSGMTEPGMKTITINEDGRPEFIFNAGTTAKNQKHFDVMNRKNLALEDYVKHSPELRAMFKEEKTLQQTVNVTVENKELAGKVDVLNREVKFMRQDMKRNKPVVNITNNAESQMSKGRL